MSRSRRKTPIFGNTKAKSDARWKAKAARILRHSVKQTLQAMLDTDRFPGKRWDAVNLWDAPKDGKHWWRSASKRDMRK
jgi:predicted component of type VI protein secretion system